MKHGSKIINSNPNKKHKTVAQLLRYNYDVLLFVLLNIIFIGGLICAICLDAQGVESGVKEKKIATLCQVITSILAFVVTTIGIALSIQQHEVMGIPMNEFNKLRSKGRYTISAFISISVFLAAIDLVFYLISFMNSMLATSIIAIIFSFIVIFSEVPIMLHNESRLNFILKQYLIKAIHNQFTWTDFSTKCLSHCINKNKSLITTYQKLKTKDDAYNHDLMCKLLETQLFVLQNKDDSKDSDIIANSVYLNIRDAINYIIMNENIDVKSINEYKHYIISTLFQLLKTTYTHDKTCAFLTEVLSILKYKKLTEVQADALTDIFYSITLSSIRDGNLDVIKTTQLEFSISSFELGQNDDRTMAFALISLQLYFLCNDSQNAAEQLKTNIKQFLEEEGLLNHTKYLSWKKLYKNFIRNFQLDFTRFIKNFSKYEIYMDVPIYFEAQWVALDETYALNWYMSQLMNSYKFSTFDFKLLNSINECKIGLLQMAQDCFDRDKQFKPTAQMINMVEFFIGNSTFKSFINYENANHNLFNVINELKKIDVMRTDSNGMSSDGIANQYKNDIMKAIQKEWGFSDSIQIINSAKGFALLLQKSNNIINYNEATKQFILNSIFHELKNNIKFSTISGGETFETELRKFLNHSDEYVYASDDLLMVVYEIHDETLKESFTHKYSNAKKFISNIITGFSFVKENGFSFNIEFPRFDARNLSLKEINEQVEKYKRADGQYVYNNVFTNRQELEEYITKNYFVLEISMRYQVKMADDGIIKLDTFGVGD